MKNKTRAIRQKEKKTIRLFPSNVKDESQQLFYLLYVKRADQPKLENNHSPLPPPSVVQNSPIVKRLRARRPIRRRALGVVLCDEVAQLLDDGVDEFLPVSVRLPELGKDVVLSARLPHPGGQERENRRRNGATQGRSERSERQHGKAHRKGRRRDEEESEKENRSNRIKLVCCPCFASHFPLSTFLCSKCPCRYQSIETMPRGKHTHTCICTGSMFSTHTSLDTSSLQSALSFAFVSLTGGTTFHQ